MSALKAAAGSVQEQGQILGRQLQVFQLRRQLEAAEAQGAADRALISELSAQRAEHAEPGPETVVCASDASCLGVGRGAFRRRR